MRACCHISPYVVTCCHMLQYLALLRCRFPVTVESRHFCDDPACPDPRPEAVNGRLISMYDQYCMIIVTIMIISSTCIMVSMMISVVRSISMISLYQNVRKPSRRDLRTGRETILYYYQCIYRYHYCAVLCYAILH